MTTTIWSRAEFGPSEWLEITQDADRRVRGGDRRRPVDPRRPREGRAGPVRDDDRARVPDALAARQVRRTRSRPRAASSGWGSTTASTRSASRRRCRSAARFRAHFEVLEVDEVERRRPGRDEGDGRARGRREARLRRRDGLALLPVARSEERCRRGVRRAPGPAPPACGRTSRCGRSARSSACSSSSTRSRFDVPDQLIPVFPAYEERFLCLVLSLLRAPRSRVIYVTSQPIHPRVIDYYFGLVPELDTPEAREPLRRRSRSSTGATGRWRRSCSSGPARSARIRGADRRPGART